MVCISHLAAGFCLLRVLDDKARHAITVYSARPTKRGLALYTVTADRESCVWQARLDITLKTTEQNRIVRTGKSEVEVANNKKAALEIEANYWQDTKHRAASLWQQSYLSALHWVIPRSEF